MIRRLMARALERERSRTIRNDLPSPLAATTGILALGLILPFGTGPAVEHLAGAAVALTSTTPLRDVTSIHDERSDAGSAATITVIVDGVPQALRSTASTVDGLLHDARIAFDRHDRVAPAPATPLAGLAVIQVDHVSSWTETVRRPIAPPVIRRFAFNLAPGATAVVDAGQRGLQECRYGVSRSGRASLRRRLLVARVLRAPRAKIVAEGVGEYTALTEIAQRGIVGTVRLADSALAMVATAYTANCSGCSGTTASGHRAGHGIVAVDPHVIPLGTKMFIPGYGHAVAGDTGGAIHGNRIDLGFNSDADAFRFGRRSITVYLIK